MSQCVWATHSNSSSSSPLFIYFNDSLVKYLSDHGFFGSHACELSLLLESKVHAHLFQNFVKVHSPGIDLERWEVYVNIAMVPGALKDLVEVSSTAKETLYSSIHASLAHVLWEDNRCGHPIFGLVIFWAYKYFAYVKS